MEIKQLAQTHTTTQEKQHSRYTPFKPVILASMFLGAVFFSNRADAQDIVEDDPRTAKELFAALWVNNTNEKENASIRDRC